MKTTVDTPRAACPAWALAVWTRRRWLQSLPVVGTGLAAGLGPGPAWATSAPSLQAPAGAVVLTVSGRIKSANEGGRALFDMPMLEAFAQHTINTRTPWFTQARRFTGPLLRDVLSAAGAQGQSLRLVALNDYRVDMPFDDVQRFDVILVRLLDDKPMNVRDKGPVMVMYPFDSRPELRRATYYGRCAWQLSTIEVL